VIAKPSRFGKPNAATREETLNTIANASVSFKKSRNGEGVA